MSAVSEIEYLLDLSSESDSEEEWETEVLLYDVKKRRKSFWMSNYMKKRRTHGEFALTSELSDTKFSNYFRLNREQFSEVHSIIEPTIYSEGCNAQKPIGAKEKLAICLR